MTRPFRSRTGRAPWIAVAVGIAAVLSGCGEGQPFETTDDAGDVVAASAQALQTPTCVTVRRGLFGDVQDALLHGDHPTWAAGDDWGLWTGLSSSGLNENRFLLRFDLDFLPPYVIVTSAVASVWVSWSPNDTVVRAHEVLVPWDEYTITPATFPANGFDPAAFGSFQTLDQGYRSIDVLDLVEAWVTGHKPNHGILYEEDPVASHYYFSSDAASASTMSKRPKLDLCYVNGPAPHEGGALVAGGVSSDSESYRFIGSLGEGPGSNHVSTSETLRFVGGLVGATQE